MEIARLSAILPSAPPTTPSLEPPPCKRKRTASVGSTFLFTFADLQRCLYNQDVTRLLKTEDVKKPQSNESQTGEKCFWCDISRTENIACPLHKNASLTGTKVVEAPKSIKTLPEEVQLCLSGIPGAGYGVCAKRLIPVGAWIGPYEGKLIQASEVTPQSDTSYMWEIYEDGKLRAFIDGNDENSSSWMRYIRCARHQQEQNLYAFQYMGKIYYRAFRDIPPGKEMLVWYDEKYPQYLGIPSNVFDMAAFIPNGSAVRPGNAVAVSPLGFNPTPQPPPSPSTSTLSPTSPRSYLRSPSFAQTASAPTNHATPALNQHGDLTRAQQPIPISQTFAGHLNNRFERVPGAECPAVKSSHKPKIQISENEFHSPTKRDVSSPGSPTKSDSDGETSNQENRAPEVSEVSLWKCGQCKKSFPQRAMLQVHVCMEYPRKPFQCGHCSESFSLPNELRTHAVIHAGKKPFRCGYCSRSFAGATTLNNHIRTHTGERPFICERCGKHFTQGSQLSRHQRIPGDCVARA